MMNYLDLHILEALIYLPMATSVVLIIIPGAHVTIVRQLSVTTATVLLAFSIYVFLSFDYAAVSIFQMQQAYPWLGPLGIDFRLGVDGISAPMVLLTGIVSFTGCVIATRVNRESKNYFVLLFILITGVYGTFVSLDLFFFFFFYELAVVPMYLLIGVWGSSSDFGTFARTKEYGALKLVLTLVAGSVLVWIAIIAIFVESGIGSFNILDLQRASLEGVFSPVFQRTIFPLLLVGFGILAGLWPFHTWSPDGHVAAPTTVSMLHAGVLMKLGAFGIIRVGMTLLPQGMEDWALVLFILATINVVYGAVAAMSQEDLKYVIGYSSVSHMGYVLMGIATMDSAGLVGATLQMFSHGLMTALFFVVVGAIYERAHTRDIKILGGLAGRMKWATVFFIFAGLTSIGLPGLSGFMSELFVFIGAFRTQPILGVAGVIGAAITAVYMLRLISRVFFGPRQDQWQGLTDLSRNEIVAAVPLVIPILVVGLYPSLFLKVIESGVSVLLDGLAG
jgi:NADH-quinone oxidoreductase subunit M